MAAPEPGGLEGRIFFVTGAGGFIGSAVVRALASRGARVQALAGPPWLPAFELPAGVTPFHADIENRPVLDQLVAGAEVVVHLAGPPSVAASFQAPGEFARVHLSGTLAVLEASRAARVSRVVYVSSAEVYGRPDRNPVSEEAPLRPRSPYAASKAAAEQFVSAYAAAYGMQTVTLRPFSVYGPRMPLTSVTATIMRQALEADEIVLGNLQPVRDYCFVDDVVSGILRAATVPCFRGNTFNLGTGVGTSVGELAQLAARLVGRRLPIRSDASRRRPAGTDIDRLIAATEHAGVELGWEPEVAIEEGLDRTLNWMQGRS